MCAVALLSCIPGNSQVMRGIVTDAANSEPLPFAPVRLGTTGQGIVTNLNGQFEFQYLSDIEYIEVFYPGYESVKAYISPDNTGLIRIKLKTKESELDEVVITPPYDKIRRLLNSAISNREKNNPDKYDWYRCKVYYKMLADVDYNIADSIAQKDTSGEIKELKQFFEDQHLMMSETYSIRSWKRPQKLQEEVLGTRVSGFKKALFTGMVTDILPFHSYNDYITLNGKDYHNPVSKGSFGYYDFNLNEELLQGRDTLWILSFKPKNEQSGLAGTVYINSDQYAIAYFVANAFDKTLSREIRLEQQYHKTGGKWFPQELNYIMKYKLGDAKDPYDVLMKGYSRIDSVSYEEEPRFKFDKAHSTRLIGDADVLSDEAWQALRPEGLNTKEQQTYVVMDSLMEKAGLDNIVSYLEKLPEGKVPISVFDLDLARLYSANRYEGSRWGLGLQTNEKIIKWLSVGGWFGYGSKDREWKYGGFMELYADKEHEFVFRFGYDNDLRDPGRVTLHREIDKNYLRRYLMNRVDNIEAYYGSVRKRMGYWNVSLSGRKEYITPQYAYNFFYEGNNHSQFEATEVSVDWRYAFAERRAPMFGRYYGTGTKYPIWYGKVTSGILESGSKETQYIQALTALQWHKHINRIGNEHFLVMAGKTWSDNPLPLSKSFAGQGLRYDKAYSYYAFGGMLTMYPYEYYSEEFVSLIFRHDFDWRLYTLSGKKSAISSAPYISLGHNMLYGRMKDRSVHRNVAFSVPDVGYHETGMTLNSILRLKYFNVYHFTLNVGYYYHWTPSFDLKKNGRYLFGLGVDL